MSEFIGTARYRVEPVFDAIGARLSRGVTRQAATAGDQAGRAFRGSFTRNVATIAAGAGLGFGFVAAAAAVRRFAGESVRAAAQQERANAVIANAVRNARAEMTLFGESIEQVLQNESLATGIADDELAPAFATLVRTTRDSAEAFRILQLAEDVAIGTGRSLTSVSLALARAQRGQVTGLSRLGVVLPGITKEMSAQERAQRALAVVTARFGGNAREVAESGEGSFRRFNVAIDELKESIGAALTPELARAADATADWLGKQENLERVQRTVRDIVQGTGQVIRELNAAFKIGVTLIRPFTDAISELRDASRNMGEAFADASFAIEDGISKVGQFLGLVESQEEQIARRTNELIEQQQFRENRRFGGEEIRGRTPFTPRPATPEAESRARRRTDADFELRVLRAQASEQIRDDLRIFQARRDFIQRRIDALENDGIENRSQRDTLIKLYGQQSSVEGEITSLQDQQRQIREQAEEKRQQALEEQRRIAEERRDRAEEERRIAEEERQRVATEYRATLAIQDAYLRIRRQRAELTEKNFRDDKSAIRAEIRVLRARTQDEKLTRIERLQYKEELLRARQDLRNIGRERRESRGGGGQAGTPADFFRSAVAQFREFGSNIAGPGGALSGQDARAGFAFQALAGRADSAKVAQDMRGRQLNEQQRTNQLLEVIANAIRPGAVPQTTPKDVRRKVSAAINEAREAAENLIGF